MIYITGDTHGDLSRIKYFCENKKTSVSYDDTMIILGDAGINYMCNTNEFIAKNKYNSYGITIFCIHGNHEERPYNVDGYKTKMWNGGIVYYQPEYEHLLFAKDGEIYTIEGKRFIALGGAYSVDKFYRLEMGYKWFESELPTTEIKLDVKNSLDKIDWNIDYVLSHTCPLKYEPTEVFIKGIDQSKVDKTAEKWLGEIEKNLKYKKWYCGHYHINKKIDNIQFLYETIISL